MEKGFERKQVNFFGHPTIAHWLGDDPQPSIEKWHWKIYTQDLHTRKNFKIKILWLFWFRTPPAPCHKIRCKRKNGFYIRGFCPVLSFLSVDKCVVVLSSPHTPHPICLEFWFCTPPLLIVMSSQISCCCCPHQRHDTTFNGWRGSSNTLRLPLPQMWLCCSSSNTTTTPACRCHRVQLVRGLLLEPLVRGSNPQVLECSSMVGGWDPTCPIRVHLGVDTGSHTKNQPTLMGQDTRNWVSLPQLVSHE